MPEGKGRLYTFRKECFKGTFLAGKKSGKGERITQKGEIIDEEWKVGVLVSFSKNVKKSGVIMGLKNDYEQMILENEQEKQGGKEEQKIEKIAETLFKNSSEEFKSKNFTSGYQEGQMPQEFENYSLIYFKDDIADFCGSVAENCVKKWSVDQVCLFLERFGFGTYVNSFRFNKMDGIALLKLREKDFEDVDILQLRDKVLIRDLIQKLKNYSKSESKKYRIQNNKTLGIPKIIDVCKKEDVFYSKKDSLAFGNIKSEDHLNPFEKTDEEAKKSVVLNRNLLHMSPIKSKTPESRNKSMSFPEVKSPVAVFETNETIPEESEGNKTELSATVKLSNVNPDNAQVKLEKTSDLSRRKLNQLSNLEVQRLSRTNSSSNTENGTGKEIDWETNLKSSQLVTHQNTKNSPLDKSPKLNRVIRKKSATSEAISDFKKLMLHSNEHHKNRGRLNKHNSEKVPEIPLVFLNEPLSKSDPCIIKYRESPKPCLRLSVSSDSISETNKLKRNKSQGPFPKLNLESFFEIKNASQIALFAQDEQGKDNFSSDDSSVKSNSSKSDSQRHLTRKHRRKNINFDISEEIGPELKSFLIKKEDIQLLTKIGDGVETSVWKGLYQHTDVAIKVFTTNKIIGGRKKFLEEAEILSSLRSTYIVLFMGLCVKFPQYYLLTEYMEDGSLMDNLYAKGERNRKQILEYWPVKLKIIESIAHGMNYLHEMNVLHCDLKPSNILVNLLVVG